MKLTRTLVKSAMWELISFVLQTILLWWWFDDLPQSLVINLFLFMIKTVCLSLYLRMWKHIKWLKEEKKEEKKPNNIVQ